MVRASNPAAGPVIVIPGAPLLVPELAGFPGDPEIAPVRAAVRDAGRWLARRADTWHVRTSADGPLPVPDGDGTFAGFGADVVVAAAPSSPAASQERGTQPNTQAEPRLPDPLWPAPLLIAAWLRGDCAPSTRIVGPDAVATGTVFVLDGPNTLTARAPGGYRPGDEEVFSAQVAAVCAAGPVTEVDPGWSAAAAAVRGGATELYRGAPFGVGYLVAVCEPAGAP